MLFLLLSLGALAQESAVTTSVKAEGSGPQAKLGDTLSIAYKLTLDNGEVVDETKGKGYQFELGSSKAIKGLSQGLLGARQGEIRELVIPPALGYGDRANGAIPANSTLHFEAQVIYLSSHQEEDEHTGDSDADHDHDHDGVPDHPAGRHAEGSSREGFENRPDAQHLDKPAIFEYMIRDFFTRPWRYNDAAQLIWKSNAVLSLLALLAWICIVIGSRKGWLQR